MSLPKGTPIVVVPIVGDYTNDRKPEAFGEVLTEIRIMRRPKAHDMIATQQYDSGGSALDSALFMLSRLSGVPQGTLHDLDCWDANEMDEAMSALLSSGPKTGKKESASSPDSLDSGA